ncbi:pantoate--beta-alanine ligase (plasmid) [Agrobacterium leguminum]|uniref:Pantothenate synthetase n=1 Tax=Agrobacterium deltaense NCPPB 1641 TaxID=1183425 RepID=A0A1S7UA04_9HYPH|nr:MULTISPECIES: pantoate--beta-alanine ligase [Agrobacterium]WFS69634.1 pantoate--beta-alanine ligase [Agrobacterium leguminum]CVI63629.1 Pantothenate synthetase [Agrobacterium deltaense NCPPB 1641]
MKIVHTISDLRETLAGKGRPAFVPTMGNLHEGHISLVHLANDLGDISVVSIFVNRLQFLPNEDFGTYPRTWDADCEALRGADCDVLFAPRESDLYPEPQLFKVQPDPEIADILEGQFRPGFFTGVCTVVMKLFSAVFATTGGGIAVFGKKDYQQLMIIRRMVTQFALPVEIVAGETHRASDGLAMSSRNGYLSASEREQASKLSDVLQRLAAVARSGEKSLEDFEAEAMRELQATGWTPDYTTVRRSHDLQSPTAAELGSAVPLVVLGAARLGATRLIDNIEL